MEEGTLHKWFKKSKSKDGKPGWVNVVTGGTCASDKPGEGTPKCVSSAKRASMSKVQRLSAARRKKKADPGQQQKTSAAKPTYVATDSKRKVKEERIISESMNTSGFLQSYLPAQSEPLQSVAIPDSTISSTNSSHTSGGAGSGYNTGLNLGAGSQVTISGSSSTKIFEIGPLNTSTATTITFRYQQGDYNNGGMANTNGTLMYFRGPDSGLYQIEYIPPNYVGYFGYESFEHPDYPFMPGLFNTMTSAQETELRSDYDTIYRPNGFRFSDQMLIYAKIVRFLGKENPIRTATFTIPDELRGQNTQIYLRQNGNTGTSWTNDFAFSNFEVKRLAPLNVLLSLDHPEAINFINSDPTLSKLSPYERKKRLQQMLKDGNEYLLKMLGIHGSTATPGTSDQGDIAQGFPYTDSDDAFDNPYYDEPFKDPGDLDGSDDESTWDFAKGEGNIEIAGLRPDGTQGMNKVGDIVPDHFGNPMKLVPRPGYGYNMWVPVKKAGGGGKTQVAHYEPKGEVIAEKSALKSLPGYYDGKPSVLGFPDNPPPKMIKGYHPDLVTSKGQEKQSARYNRLDPQSAKAMPKTGNPFIDAKAKAAVKSANSKKKMKEEVTEAKDKKGKGSGKKDACYHKVKSRYSVWPSAYASGALVKCRKVGAANWGNKSEEVEIQEKKKGGAKKCWPGYKKVGTQKLFGKTYNRCVKASYEVGGITFKEFRELSEGAAWTKKSGKNKEGGLNEKGRKSYEKENPGSDLKAPSKKVGNPRRKSFCARMKGMKAKLTSAKTARDPDSRINKSLRAWNC